MQLQMTSSMSLNGPSTAPVTHCSVTSTADEVDARPKVWCLFYELTKWLLLRAFPPASLFELFVVPLLVSYSQSYNIKSHNYAFLYFF